MGTVPDDGAARPRISLVIAARNASGFIHPVMASIRRSETATMEVVVVDDCSTDDTAELATMLGAKLVRLESPAGAAAARNAGAREATGDVVMFIDHDCCLCEDTIDRVLEAMARYRGEVVLGGTYTLEPFDAHRFASCLQSLHVHYSETRRPDPDYIASHCFIMVRALFLREGGFPEALSLLLANGCCQDVLFSHLLRRRGYRLVMDPSLQVRHIFNFTVRHSIFNAFWKSRAWTRFALSEGSLLRDSGSASSEMKVSSVLLTLALASLMASAWWKPMALASLALAAASLAANARLYAFIFRHKGTWFTLRAAGLYSLQLLAVVAGGVAGLAQGPLTPARNAPASEGSCGSTTNMGRS
ncbi:glycosyltransferase [Candidatus Fermentibacteria bacterium]|nr:glycosyltransferase [Candidatus Fermentibacteria bacterium]